MRPDLFAGLQRQREDAAVFERQVQTIARRSRRRAQRRSEIPLPEDFTVGGANREQRSGFGRREQPARVPMQRDDASRRPDGAIARARQTLLALRQVRRCRRRRDRRPPQAAQSSGIRPTTRRCRPSVSSATSWFVRSGTYTRSSSNAGANAGGAGSVALHFTSSGNVTAAVVARAHDRRDKKCHGHTRYGGATERHPAIIACNQRLRPSRGPDHSQSSG